MKKCIATIPDFLRSGLRYKNLKNFLPDMKNHKEYYEALIEEISLPNEIMIETDEVYDFQFFERVYKAFNAMNVKYYSYSFYLFAFRNKEEILERYNPEFGNGRIKLDKKTLHEIETNSFILEHKGNFLDYLEEQNETLLYNKNKLLSKIIIYS